MGAVQQTNAIYLTISNGQLTRRFNSPTKTSKERVNKKGTTVHEEFYKGWKGRITGIAIQEHKEYGKFWNVTITDEQGDAIIQMNYSSGYSAAFLKTLPNIDLKSDIVFSPSMKIEGDKKKATVFISQHGKPIKWAYTKDDPKGLPELKQVKFKNKVSWDDSDIMEFLEKMVFTEIVPKLPKAGGAADADVPLPDEQDAEELELEAEAKKVKDKLPF
jgi:hypothetical protein